MPGRETELDDTNGDQLKTIPKWIVIIGNRDVFVN